MCGDGCGAAACGGLECCINIQYHAWHLLNTAGVHSSSHKAPIMQTRHLQIHTAVRFIHTLDGADRLVMMGCLASFLVMPFIL